MNKRQPNTKIQSMAKSTRNEARLDQAGLKEKEDREDIPKWARIDAPWTIQEACYVANLHVRGKWGKEMDEEEIVQVLRKYPLTYEGIALASEELKREDERKRKTTKGPTWEESWVRLFGPTNFDEWKDDPALN